ncbi:carboxyl transferase domain-containing protein [Nocardiopsis changdeensis]|uniref:Acetyl-CoA carboxylase carboxyltransferase subunit alpha/beta n=1 Tax=Nocardiopsis changdeensis TaxID=2831969 RepID=A0ABX8BSC0_9ACTN|nr:MULTISPECIES: carboxyl transferase domain-containing protein [Nocardiopsis]QUX25140.1 acetyl-CoA carboxylase carboxyltransferase subunit alpha/beta [Nocardiopsis changdeensis]QYX35527.1 acetyl-CoA carboxylase carboxyltransferase subunit alpha/beta [Nocardiopsis sp. MT53]
MATRYGARDLLDRILDPGSFRSWDTTPVDVRPDPSYAADLARARAASGCDEAILTGEGLLRGRRVAVAAGEFAFLAGSVGVAAAERLVTAVERATAARLPLLVSPASGGTRMQEGTVAFLAMVKIAAAIAAHKAAGLPYLVYLRDPTTGGVLASWGSLGHVTVAEPGALVGFLGPRVYSALYGADFPEGVQRAENLLDHGLIDAVLPPEELPAIADRALTVLLARDTGDAPPPPAEPAAATPAWTAVTRSRRPGRPGVRALLRHAATDVVRLRGSGEGESDPGLLLALARFGGSSCVLLGQDRDRQTPEHPMGPAALRAARRGMRLADELGLPLVTVIDTPGAALSKEAEEQGMAGQIARCLTEMATLAAPTLALLLGQGTGGGALALIPADRVLCAQNAWLSPLPPEGASAIVHRTTEKAADLARDQGIGSTDLRAHGIVDRIVPEHDDAADEPEEFCRRAGLALRHELAALTRAPGAARRAARAARYRRLGLPS